MHFAAVQRLIGILLMVFSITMLPPIGVALWYADGQLQHFLLSLVLCFGAGFVCWLPVRRHRRELRVRDGFILVTLFWAVLGLLGGIPFLLSAHLGFTDAVFESISGVTTTGATVITGLDGLPRSILYYRQQLQWLGGMGVIVLAVAVFPMLGVGGMQLYRAETPGPMKHQKLTPRVRDTARSLLLIYFGLTAACAAAYWLAGMTPFDAIGHSFSTVSTGGFSTHDANLGYFHSALIDAIAMVFMLLGAMNFAVHFRAWSQRSLRSYLRDEETLAFLVAAAACVIVVTLLLWMLEARYAHPLLALRYALFHVISTLTTTGFTTANFHAWPSFVPIMLIFLSFVGGCAGSTAGGMKVVRMLLLLKQALREVSLLIHPRSVALVKLGNRPVQGAVVNAVWGFFTLYVLITAAITLVLVGTGLNVLSAYSATAACLNIMGRGLGEVARNYEHVSVVGKWVLMFAMLLGRLEIFTLFVLLTPAFWRK